MHYIPEDLPISIFLILALMLLSFQESKLIKVVPAPWHTLDYLGQGIFSTYITHIHIAQRVSTSVLWYMSEKDSLIQKGSCLFHGRVVEDS